jgi:hypothetical protein
LTNQTIALRRKAINNTKAATAGTGKNVEYSYLEEELCDWIEELQQEDIIGFNDKQSTLMKLASLHMVVQYALLAGYLISSTRGISQFEVIGMFSGNK